MHYAVSFAKRAWLRGSGDEKERTGSTREILRGFEEGVAERKLSFGIDPHVRASQADSEPTNF